MTPYAHVVSGTVREITPPLDENGLAAFSPAMRAQLVPVPAGVAVAQGWTYGGSTFAAPSPNRSAEELLSYASARQNIRLADVWSFNVAAAGASAHMVTTLLDPAGQNAMLKIAVWSQMNAQAEGAALPYSNVDFTSSTLSPAECASLATQTGAVDAQSYAILNQVAQGIAAATVTTFAQIDTAFAALGA